MAVLGMTICSAVLEMTGLIGGAGDDRLDGGDGNDRTGRR